MLVEGGSVRARTARACEEGGAVVSDMCMCMCMHMHIVMCVWAGAAWADLLYSLLHIPLYRKLLYKAIFVRVRLFPY